MNDEEKRERFEPLIQSWNGSEMWFQERHLQFPGRVEITTNDWGVSITIISEYFRKFSVSGCWEILRVSDSRISALYCGWTLDKEMVWHELGIFPSKKIIDIGSYEGDNE